MIDAETLRQIVILLIMGGGGYLAFLFSGRHTRAMLRDIEANKKSSPPPAE